MRRFVIAVLAVVLVTGARVAQAGSNDEPHYPDLRTQPPSQLKVQKDRATGQKLLRFSNTVANLGDGALELRPDTHDGVTDAYQRIYSHDAYGNFSVQSEALVDTFVFHAGHGHFHFEHFALYELRTVADGGGPGALVTSSEKVSFCIIDTGLADSNLEHSSPQTYTSCGQSAIQGLSVGWSDTYTWNLAGQSIDITSVQDGTYWLVSTADPDGLLNEGGGAAETNNTAAVKIRLRNNSVRVVP